MEGTHEESQKKLDTKRRNLLKLALFGGGAFVLGKVLGPSLSFMPKELSMNGEGKETIFSNFRVRENGEELGIYDDLGNEILVIEKD